MLHLNMDDSACFWYRKVDMDKIVEEASVFRINGQLR